MMAKTLVPVPSFLCARTRRPGGRTIVVVGSTTAAAAVVAPSERPITRDTLLLAMQPAGDEARRDDFGLTRLRREQPLPSTALPPPKHSASDPSNSSQRLLETCLNTRGTCIVVLVNRGRAAQMGGKPSSEAVSRPAKHDESTYSSRQSSRRFQDALIDSTTIDEMLEVVQRRLDSATPQTTSVALRHLTVRQESWTLGRVVRVPAVQHKRTRWPSGLSR